MAILRILRDSDPALRSKTRPVGQINDRIITLLDDMRDTLRNAKGVGLAAVQVGVLRRVVVIEVEEGKLYELINPEIIETRGKQNEVEGCLSSPGLWAVTDRPMFAKVRAYDRNGKAFELEGEDLTARAICHEVDHLDGILFRDHALRILTPEEAEKYNKK